MRKIHRGSNIKIRQGLRVVTLESTFVGVEDIMINTGDILCVINFYESAKISVLLKLNSDEIVTNCKMATDRVGIARFRLAYKNEGKRYEKTDNYTQKYNFSNDTRTL